MNRWNIDIRSVQMSGDTRKILEADPAERERVQSELDRILPIEFDGYVDPTPCDCCVKEVGGRLVAYIP